MSRSLRSSPSEEVAEYDDNTLAILHLIQTTGAADHKDIAAKLRLPIRVVKRSLNQLRHDRQINRITTRQNPVPLQRTGSLRGYSKSARQRVLLRRLHDKSPKV
jgi:DNA-binding Lrp family transcriptional regulator